MLKFEDYLRKDNEVEVINYNKDGNTFSGRIELQAGDIKGFDNKPPLGDTDCVYENLDTKQFGVTSQAKFLNSAVIHYIKSEYCTGLVCGHYSRPVVYNYLLRDRLTHKFHLIKPWIFGVFQEYDVDKFRAIREGIEFKDLNDKLYFKGSGWKDVEKGYRKTIRVLHEKGYLDPNNVHIDKYLEDLARQRYGLSHYLDLDLGLSYTSHQGEMCYRDIEMCSLGVPFIRVEYKSEMHEGFKPYIHYIPIQREVAAEAYRKGKDEAVAELYINKYKEIVSDEGLFNYISKNQIEWYEKYWRFPKSAELTKQLLNMDKW